MTARLRRALPRTLGHHAATALMRMPPRIGRDGIGGRRTVIALPPGQAKTTPTSTWREVWVEINAKSWCCGAGFKLILHAARAARGASNNYDVHTDAE